MNVPQIQIRQTFGQIGLSYTSARWSIRTQPADLSIDAPAAVLSIHTVPGRLDIDQTQAFADEGLRTPLAFAVHEAARARQTAAEGVAETADWGQRLLHIERGDAWPSWMMRYRESMRQVVPALVPRPFSVHIHGEPGHVDIRADVRPVRVSVQTHPVQVAFSPGSVKTFVATPPQIRILSPPVGRLLDTRV
ncbi:MAG: DUF6470 family protein [Alicyclobacillus sp.]|nr:DUF6470 family protein [Alicyclobacillus sp.]